MFASAFAASDSPRLTRFPLQSLAPLLVSVGYYLGAEAAFGIGTLTQQFAPFWPPNIVLFGALLLMPRRQWPLCIAAAFPAHVAAEWGASMPLYQLMLAFASNVSVASLNAVALTRLIGGPPWLGSLRNASLYLLCAAVVNPALVAILAGFEPILSGADPSQYWVFWGRWFLSNALGNLTLMPVFLTALGEGGPAWPGLPSRRRVLEAAILASALLAAASAAFDSELTQITTGLFPAVLYLPVPILLAVAVRFGPRGASWAVLAVTVMVLFGTMHGHGPFADGPPGREVAWAQIFLAINAVPAMLLAAIMQELRQANRKLAGVLGGISDSYYTLDASGRVTAINSNGAARWGAATSDQLVGRNYWEIPGKQPEEQAWVRQALQAGYATHGELATSDRHWIDIHAYPSAGGVSVFCHDMTERRAAEVRARRTQTLLQSSLDALTEQIAILERTGKIIAINASWRKAAEAIAPTGECHLLGANYLEECDRTRPHSKTIAAGLRKIIAAGSGEFRLEYPSDLKERRWFQLRATCFGSGSELRLVVAVEDITEMKTSESALRRLTGSLLRSQDETARRIARELHDATAQNLLAATLDIGQALRLEPTLKETARTALEESHRLIEQSQREIRTVAYLLHPPLLDEAGLPAALRWLCEGFAKRTAIAVDLDIPPDMARLPPGLEAALFRIVQEALSNVHRHSGSPTVRIALEFATSPAGERSISLVVEDQGRGIPAIIDAPTDHATRLRELQNTGVGLAGMRERLRQFGGRLDIRSSSQGTVVTVVAPVDDGGFRATTAALRPVASV
jgi:signal transduction histidine kinase